MTVFGLSITINNKQDKIMKIVQVNDKLRIRNSDNLNWTIEELKIAPETLKSGEPNPKAGEETWKGHRHYPKLEYACMKCADIILADGSGGDVSTLESVISEIRAIRLAIVPAIYEMEKNDI